MIEASIFDGDIAIFHFPVQRNPRRFPGDELDDIRIAGRVAACYYRV
jgi:hypothetical protein